MSIGEVLAVLRPEFPDVTISKIRFLEDQGLVEPGRSPSGYRKFTHGHVERLRYVLAVQRDHYLPLRVIREHLDALDRGLDPPALPHGGPGVPRLVGASTGPDRFDRGSDLRLSRAELIATAPVDPALLDDLESFGLLSPAPGTGSYDAEAVTIARSASELARFGIQPRHLRGFKVAAEREAGLVEQVVTPLRSLRGPEAAGRADEAAREVVALCLRLHAALVKSCLERSRH
jgi:DNA-binding transcriptional MerR regulator